MNRKVLTQYNISNLEQLRDMIDDVLSSARAVAGRKVHPSEISFTGDQLNFVGFSFDAVRLADGSVVYDVQCETEVRS